MGKASFSSKVEKYHVGFQHVALFLVMVAALFLLIFYYAIPVGASNFVVSLFAPTPEQQEKIGFVRFDGLVWASTTKDVEEKIGGQSVAIKDSLINKDYIFDFTFEERTIATHGYAKKTSEFYAKSETLGEHGIILEPYIGFSVIALVLAAIIAMLVSMVMPSAIGFMAALFEKQIDHTKVKIRLQTGFPDEVVELLTLPEDRLANLDRDAVESAYKKVWDRTQPDEESTKRAIKFEDIFDEETDIVIFRNQALYNRIKEFFSEFVLSEIEDTKNGLVWRRNHFQIFKGMQLYMAHHFTEKYSNNVTGLAYGGAALLIVAVGIRGLKFIPATKPSFILFAIFMEFTMLALLAVTLFYTEEEERMDKMLKKMEDANQSQLGILRDQAQDMKQLASALVGQPAELVKKRVEEAISQFMTSDDNVKATIAKEIADKIIFDLKRASQETEKS